jgi:hypothetical protein
LHALILNIPTLVGFVCWACSQAIRQYATFHFQVLHIVYPAGEGLGSERRGRADPIMAGDVKKDHLGVGAVQPGEVTSEDDIYEQYKKRMMLGYRYRPNPLVYWLPLPASRSSLLFLFA